MSEKGNRIIIIDYNYNHITYNYRTCQKKEMIDYDYNYNILQPYYDYNYNHTGNTMQTGKKKQSCLGRLGTASVEKTMDTR